jgi:hypothetical protein
MSRLFVEHREAVVAEIDVTRRRLGEQGRRELRLSCDVLPERHVTLGVVCAPSGGGKPLAASCIAVAVQRNAIEAGCAARDIGDIPYQTHG